jgi:hypothetical protein
MIRLQEWAESAVRGSGTLIIMVESKNAKQTLSIASLFGTG